MREVNFIAVVLKGYRKSQRVIVGALLPAQAILVVGYPVTTTCPANAFGGCIDGGIPKGPHSLVVDGRWLDHIQNVEAVFWPLARVAHSEEVPLRV